MQGMYFIIIDNKGQVVNSGQIVSQITPERYLCQFMRKPTSCRVVQLTEIEGWNLFPDVDQSKAFLEALKTEPEKTADQMELLRKNAEKIEKSKEAIKKKTKGLKKKASKTEGKSNGQ